MKKFLLLLFATVFCISMSADTLVDELTSTLTGITKTTYTEFTISGSNTPSGTAYAGLCAGTATYIQLRSATSSNYSGIYNTTSCGKVTKVTVTWDASSYNRTLNIYGSSTPFNSTEDLYGSNLTLIGSATGPATKQDVATVVEVNISGDYPYVGFRSEDGALYINMIAIEWDGEKLDNPDEPEPTPTGHGYEPDDPFTPAEAIALAETMTSSETVSGVYVKGIISRIDEVSTSYGNATYFISEDGTTDNQFEVYRGYYLDGAKFTSVDQIALGDEVVVTGDLVNYYGNTPELTSGNYIYSINGSSETEPEPTPTGHGYEPDDPFTTAEAIELAVSMTASQTVSGVYVKGYITQISEVSTSYGNATYYISTGSSVGDEFEIYRGYYLGGEKFTSEDQIAIGDEVVVTGDLVNYYGNTPELTSGNYIYSLNGDTGNGDEPEPEPEPTPPGSTQGVTITDTTVTLTNEALTEGDEEVAIDFTLQGYENAESVDEVPITLDEYTTVTFAKGEGNNEPMYYNTNTAIRMYADNTLTITSSKKLAKVVLNCASSYTGNDIATASFEDNEIVYCNYYTQNSGGTQVRCQTLVVTYALEGGDETGISEVAVSLDNDGKEYNISGQQVSKDYKGIVITNGKKVLKK